MAIVNRTALLARREVKRAISKVRRTLRSVLWGESFGEREVEALTISGEAVRELLREELQAIANSFGEEVLVNGVRYHLHEPGSDTYHGLCGPLEIKRPTHREVGVHNGRIVVAVELVAGLVEGATPGAGLQRGAWLRAARHAGAQGEPGGRSPGASLAHDAGADRHAPGSRRGGWGREDRAGGAPRRARA